MKRTAVIGASPDPERYSFKAVESLRRFGIECIAIGLKQGYIDDVVIQQVPDSTMEIDTVSLYVGPKNQSAWKEIILKLHPKRVIFNPGTENPAFELELQSHGIITERACTLVLLSTGQY